MSSFSEVVSSKLPEKFPNLRFGFIEAGASWIPYSISQLGAKIRQAQRGQDNRLPHLFELAPELFRENRAFITIDLIDDIESVLKFGTEDSLMIGTDYSHTDISANLSALNGVRDWVDQGRISTGQAHKILESNAEAFYGL
jgi:hypothetical protein